MPSERAAGEPGNAAARPDTAAGQREDGGAVTIQLPIPSGQESLTPDWLTGVLQQAGVISACRVAEARTEPAGQGQVADCFRCLLRYDEAEERAPGSVIVKLPARDPTSRESGVTQALYSREVRFYTELAGVVGITTPRCLHADIDAGSGMFALVLDDLAPARETDQLSGLTPDDACTALHELAAANATNRRIPSANAAPSCGTSAAVRSAGMTPSSSAVRSPKR
jgi:hypothetical protein